MTDEQEKDCTSCDVFDRELRVNQRLSRALENAQDKRDMYRRVIANLAKDMRSVLDEGFFTKTAYSDAVARLRASIKIAEISIRRSDGK